MSYKINSTSLLAILALTLPPPTQALSQSASEPSATSKAKAAEKLRADAQNRIDQIHKDLDHLIEKAKPFAGTPQEYTSVIRQGLGLLSGTSLAQLLSRGTRNQEALKKVTPSVVKGVDDDKAVLTRLNAEIERLRNLKPDDLIITQKENSENRIEVKSIGGVAIKGLQYSQSVALGRSGRSIGCSGTAIAKGWVLTAAHCVCLLGIHNGARIKVKFGRPGLNKTSVIARSLIASERRVMGGDSFCKKLLDSNYRVCSTDLALLKYQQIRPGELKYVKYARLPSKNEVKKRLADLRDFNRGIAVGFGLTSYSTTDTVDKLGRGLRTFELGPTSFKLEVSLPVATECSNRSNRCTAQRHGCIPGKEFMLVDAVNNFDTCNGDSGGPIYLPTSNGYNPVGGRHGRPVIVGVTSRSIDPTGKCGPGGIYVKTYTPEVRNWLCKVKDIKLAQPGFCALAN